MLLGILFFPAQVLADGMIISPSAYRVFETGQKAVVWFANNEEILILSTNFEGDAADFGWIIPVPARPEVEKGSDEIFTALVELTEPEYKIQPQLLEKGFGTLESPGAEKVTVVETKKVDIYDVSVVTSSESEALAEWFAENNYPYPVSQAYILNEYINNKWFFVAAKINTENLGANVQGQLHTGHATPLLIKFETKKIVYPLKISSVTGDFYQTDIVYQEGFNDSVNNWETYGGTFEFDRTDAYEGQTSLQIVTNQEETPVESGYLLGGLEKDKNYVFSAYLKAGKKSSGAVYLSVSQNGLDEKSASFVLGDNWKRLIMAFTAQAKSHRLKIIGKDFIKGETFNIDAIQVEVGTKATPFEDIKQGKIQPPFFVLEEEEIPVRRMLPSLSYPYPSNEMIEVLLYVFDFKKKVEIPGFTAEYAGWVQPKQIEDLALDTVGDPLLSAKRKMYLTKLRRVMRQDEMTSDLYPRYADRNQAIGQGSSISIDPFMVVFVFAIPLLLEIIFAVWLFGRRKEP